ncbi:MAG: carboxypeptidase-like regulatory domain-containing protein, partial [Deltaproteobacteria bacterium]
KNGFESSYSAEQQGIPAEVIRYYAISGKVKDYKGNGVSGVTVTISATPSIQTTTDASGNYTFSGLASGSYKLIPSKGKKDKFTPGRKTISVTSKDAAGVDFTLKKDKK